RRCVFSEARRQRLQPGNRRNLRTEQRHGFEGALEGLAGALEIPEDLRAYAVVGLALNELENVVGNVGEVGNELFTLAAKARYPAEGKLARLLGMPRL